MTYVRNVVFHLWRNEEMFMCYYLSNYIDLNY